MKIEKYQAWMNKFDELAEIQNKGNEIPIALHAAEEMGEVAQCVLKLSGWKGKKNETIEHLEEEICDVIGLMAKLANCYDIDLGVAMKRNQEKLEKRWGVTVDK